MIMVMEDFLTYLSEVKNLSANTIVSYHNDLTKLLHHLDKQNIKTVEKINETSINSYVLAMEKDGMSPATVSRNIASIKAFVFFLIKQGKLREDPTERIKAPKVEKKAPHTLSIQQVDDILNQPSQVTLKGIRDKAMLELLYATGIRVSELISLQLENINFKSKYIKCYQGNKERIIPFGNMAKHALDEYINIARPLILGKVDTQMCFTNLSGDPMSRQGFWKIIKCYGKAVGITDDITPQILRNSFALHMIENGADIRSVQELLGLSDVSSTQVYLKNRTRKLRDVYSDTHPRA